MKHYYLGGGKQKIIFTAANHKHLPLKLLLTRSSLDVRGRLKRIFGVTCKLRWTFWPRWDSSTEADLIVFPNMQTKADQSQCKVKHGFRHQLN